MIPTQIEEAEYLIILINQNNINKKAINLINKYISLFPSKVLGWYFFSRQKFNFEKKNYLVLGFSPYSQ